MTLSHRVDASHYCDRLRPVFQPVTVRVGTDRLEDQRSRSRQSPLVERLVHQPISVALVLREIAVIAFCAVRHDNGRGPSNSRSGRTNP